MPSLKKTSAQNPMSGAGIIRYFDAEKGIQVDPKVIIGIACAFVVFEIVLSML